MKKRVPEVYVVIENSRVKKSDGSRGNRGIMSWATLDTVGKGVAFGKNQEKENLPCGLNTLGTGREE